MLLMESLRVNKCPAHSQTLVFANGFGAVDAGRDFVLLFS